MATSINRLVLIIAVFLVMLTLPQGLHAKDRRYCARCHRTLVCPQSCPKFNDASAKFLCNINCKRCRATCHKNACNKIGAVCNDPRFVGGDGIFFYFHGKSNEDFCIVSDTSIHINGHFIGRHVEGRSRDFTWVQAIAILFGSHKVSIGANKVAIWDDGIDQLEMSYDGMPLAISPVAGEKWEAPLREFTVARTDDLNSVEVEVPNLVKVAIKVTCVDQLDDKVHNYGIPYGEDCFAHLDLHFSFFSLSGEVDGVLGQTYKRDYQSLVKSGVPMPIMGGYDRFKSSSLFATDCRASRFNKPAALSQASTQESDLYAVMPGMSCSSNGENGIVCRR